MNATEIIAELESLYPGRLIKRLPENDPLEVICEFDPTDSHPDWSRAVAVIDRSAPHFHQRIVVLYHVVKGELLLHVDNDQHKLYEGQQFTITPGQIHWAEGDGTWVEIYCTPGYSPDDHFLADDTR